MSPDCFLHLYECWNYTTVSVYWQIPLIKLTLSCYLSAGNVDLSRWFHHPHLRFFLVLEPECQKDAPTLFFLVYNCLMRPVCSFVFFLKARLLRNIIEKSLQSVTVYGDRIPTLSIYERRALVSRRARGESSDPLHLFPFRLLTATHKVMYHQQLENMLEMANGVAAISV